MSTDTRDNPFLAAASPEDDIRFEPDNYGNGFCIIEGITWSIHKLADYPVLMRSLPDNSLLTVKRLPTCFEWHSTYRIGETGVWANVNGQCERLIDACREANKLPRAPFIDYHYLGQTVRWHMISKDVWVAAMSRDCARIVKSPMGDTFWWYREWHDGSNVLTLVSHSLMGRVLEGECSLLAEAMRATCDAPTLFLSACAELCAAHVAQQQAPAIGQ